MKLIERTTGAEITIGDNVKYGRMETRLLGLILLHEVIFAIITKDLGSHITLPATFNVPLVDIDLQLID